MRDAANFRTQGWKVFLGAGLRDGKTEENCTMRVYIDLKG